MINFIKKYSQVLTAFAVVLATHSANMACCFYFNQPKVPDSVKKLRKF